MKFGYFDDTNREYVITTPHTPLPWINYLGMDSMFGLVSQTGAGYDFYRDAKLRRITRYRYNNLPRCVDGRTFYLKEGDDIWSPGFLPARAELDSYRCRHGLGYTVIDSSRNSLRAEVKFFIPLNESVEIRQLILTNDSTKVKQFKLFEFTEFCLWDASEDDRNFQRNLSCGEVEIEEKVVYHKTEYRERRNHYAYLSSSVKPDSLDTDRDSFLGNGGDLYRPEAVLRGKCADSFASGWSPVAAMQFDITLQPGESKEISFLLGYIEVPKEEKFSAPGVINKKPAYAQMAKFDTPQKIEQAFAALNSEWDKLLDILRISDSPDDKFTRMVNIWHPYQCMVTFNMSRSASLFESGVGRGMGFRDSNQDLLGFAHLIPKRARERILDLAATQKVDGGAYHQYQPLTKRGNSDIGGNFNDDPLWLILSVTSYIKETGDFSILEEIVPYENDNSLAAPLLDHLFRSHNHTVNKTGPHGLPCIGRADWNDCLNLNCFSAEPGESFQTFGSGEGKVAESLMIAGLFVYAAKEFALLLDELKMSEQAAQVRTDAGNMTTKIDQHGRAKEWFLRAYDSFGNKVGSPENEDGQIYIESQGWCVMAGIGREDGFARKALDSVKKHLDTKHGLVLQEPPYRQYHLELGEVSSYPPGYKENGGIFCHTNPWIIIAETMLDDPDKAFEYYSKIAPAYREEISEIHRCEPYVYAQMIAGKAAPRFGEAKNSWLTGTAAWNYVAAMNYLLGIRPSYNGLIIDPKLPAKELPVAIKRKFRNSLYDIAINKGEAKRLVVNGKDFPYGSPIPFTGDNIKVEVFI